MKQTVPMVPIRVHADESFRRLREPVFCGLPWPRHAVRSSSQFRLVGLSGQHELLQSTVLDRWPDGSVRWCLFDFFATPSDADGYRIEVVSESGAVVDENGPQILPVAGRLEEFDTEALRLRMGGNSSAGHGLFCSLHSTKSAAPVELTIGLRFDHKGAAGPRIYPKIRVRNIERGSVRSRVHFESNLLPGELLAFGHVDLYTGSPVVRVQITLRNTRAASHPGGTWDLGNKGSVLIRDFTISVRLPPATGPATIRCSVERGAPFLHHDREVEVDQDSSGGENWKHHTHLNRDRVVPHRFQGYRVTSDGKAQEGLRATPIVTVERAGQFVGITTPHFWENFPKSIAADENGITFALFPPQSAAAHELQGGEQKTHVFYVACGKDEVTEEPLAWCRSPLIAHADHEWYVSAEAVPYLTPAAGDANAAYLGLAELPVEGPDTFFTKRERIDEYGWRNFGEVYADHEAVYHRGSERLVSHYNNQFDVINGCIVQFLRSADMRWWELFVTAADHMCDIDMYHTNGDKQAYNGGLFPFTFHYADADTSTHRGYPRVLQSAARVTFGRDFETLGTTGEVLKQVTARGLGGGPSASHVYNQGVMLAYFLTGNPLYLETAIGLAEFVVNIDAPRAILRCLSSEYSGSATTSGTGDYHGPGRASGNSILALLVGHRLTGRREFLDKAEQIIRRASHPNQDIDSLDLLNAELRWFYVMHLQALGHYLDYKLELGELDNMYAYARLTLLHFAQWMASHERPFLDQLDRLQYPTETWPAQDMRKVEAFQFAAKHAHGSEKAQFLERAEWFFRYVERALSEFSTRSLCRPVNLMMNFGWSHAWWQQHPNTMAPEPAVQLPPEEFGEWRMFVPQKARAFRRAKVTVAATAILGVLFAAGLVYLLIR